MIAISQATRASETYTLPGTEWCATVRPEDWETGYSFRNASKLRTKVRKELQRISEGRKARAKVTPRYCSHVSFVGVRVPDEWVIDHGYGSVHGNYYAGGRWKSNGNPKLHLRIGVTWTEVQQAYLCEQAGGTLRTLPGWGEELPASTPWLERVAA